MPNGKAWIFAVTADCECSGDEGPRGAVVGGCAVKLLNRSKLGALWRDRVGDWRIIAGIEAGVLCSLVVRIGNRGEVDRI